MQVKLVMFGANGDRRMFPILRDMTVVGRREDCDLRIPVGNVSRKHCRLVKDDSGLRVEDLGSSNGTYRNGERVQESALEAGDVVKVGPVAFVVQIDGTPADDEIQQPTAARAAGAPVGDGELAELGIDEVVEHPAEISGNEADEFDPMSALAGSDSGINIEGAPQGDSMQSDEGIEEVE